MKRILALFFIAAIGSSVFAEESVNVYFEADRLIQAGLFDNRNEITEAARFLTSAQRSTLYAAHKKDAVIPFLANWFIGFGVGSFLQDDVVGMSTVLITGAVGAGLLAYGMSPLFAFRNPPDYMDTAKYEAYSNELNRRMNRNIPFLLAGCGFFVAGGIYSLIRPWTYAESWNETLRSALNPAQNAEISFVPLSDGQSLGCGIRIEL